MLATKLYIPRTRAETVSRVRLLNRLEQGRARRLTLLAAPAVFGKTTLLTDWIARIAVATRVQNRPFPHSAVYVAWLALDAGDSDPTVFLRNLLAALQTIDPSIGSSTLTLLRTAQAPALESLLQVLGTDLASLPPNSMLVLDDYHVIESQAVHQTLAFLVEHLPAQVHLVISSRIDPPLPLGRLRARGQLSEFRAADLRFTLEEADVFFKDVMDLPLPVEQVSALEDRTEGWIAGLQLAALALQHRDDTQPFVEAFAGTNRFIVDYLVEEVIERLPARLHSFVLQTSILDRLSGPLCDAVLGLDPGVQQPSPGQAAYSQLVLVELERANVFLFPLDDERRWYRYHHLFADVVRARLQQGVPSSQTQELHRRASVWYEQAGYDSEAMHHALAAADWRRVVQLLIPGVPRLVVNGGQFHTVLTWLKAVPDAILELNPTLYVYYAAALMYTNHVDHAQQRLDDAEHALDRHFSDECNAAEARLMRGQVAVIQGAIHRIRGNLAQCVEVSQQALDLMPEPETTPLKVRPLARLNAARAFLVTGRVTLDVEEQVAAAFTPLRASGNWFALLASLTTLARLHVLQGRLRQAGATYAEALTVAPGDAELRATVGGASYYLGIGDLHREWNNLQAAEHALRTGLDLIQGSVTVDADVLAFGYISYARLHQARGNTAEALATVDTFLDDARQRTIAEHLIARGMAERARVALMNGDLESSIAWSESSGLALDDEITFVHENVYLLLARVHIAMGTSDPGGQKLRDALGLLERMLTRAEADKRANSVVPIQILRALALHAQGNRVYAHAALGQALTVAAPGGYIRMFVDEGAVMAGLLHDVQQTGVAQFYIGTLLGAFAAQEEATKQPRGSTITSSMQATAQHPRTSPLIEPLTDRELEVLQLLVRGLSNQAIADELVVAVGTIKRHLNSIFTKLESRLEASARARELGLM